MLFLLSTKQSIDKHKQDLDVLEQNYVDYFVAHSKSPRNSVFIPVLNHPSNAERLLKRLKPECIILTGGNNLNLKDPNGKKLDDLAFRRDTVETYLYKYAKQYKVPVLAICRGFQHINHIEGGNVELNLLGHSSQNHNVVYQNKTYKVNSYHKHGILKSQLASCFEPIVFDEKSDIIEGFVNRDSKVPVLALQWHPERPGADDVLFSILYEKFLSQFI
jgi:gamma-glutamyl-gamma-aminobutyrate hydrolase PuuD